MDMQRKPRPWARPALHVVVILAGALTASCALLDPFGEIAIERKGLSRNDPLDEIVGRAFACLNQHGKKRNEKFGHRIECGAESALLRHLKAERAAGTEIVSYLRQRRGTCGPAGAGKVCRVVREVTSRTPSSPGSGAPYWFAHTTFTVDIELGSNGDPWRVSIDRYDIFDSKPEL